MISIIIPVHNGEKFIRRAIESVKSQCADWELIIVNDHSVDATEEILIEYASDDDRIRYISAVSTGVTDARMSGVVEASGEYVFFMDADDELPSGVIKAMDDAIKNDCELDLVVSDIIDVYEDDNQPHNYGEKSFTDGRQLFNWIIDNRTGFLWGKAIRKELFESLEYVPSELKFCEDYVQMLQLSLKSKKIKHIGIPGYIYYQNPDSTCNTIKSRGAYANQFYWLAVALKRLTELSDFKNYDLYTIPAPITRLKVMFLFYLRLYLAVAGGWKNDSSNLKQDYKRWMNDSINYTEPLYDANRRFQTRIAYYFPRLVATVYVPVLKYKYHRIK